MGRDQLVPRLRNHPQVECLEGINARELPLHQLHAQVPEGFAGVVMDVSFISQTLIHPELARLIPAGCPLLSLVKPQFEAGPGYLGKGGLINNPEAYPLVREKIIASLTHCGFRLHDYFASAINGGDGNQEFFVAAFRE